MAIFRKLALAAAAAATVSAHAAPVVLQNPFIRAGVNDVGTLGSGNGTSPGILFDGTGTSTYGVNDFLTPGTPFEGFYITGTGLSLGSNNSGPFSSFASTGVTGGGTSASWVGTDVASGLMVSHTYSLTVNAAGRAAIAVETTLTNNGNATLADLAFLRVLDPDPDVNAFGSFATNNIVVSPTQVCATGTSSGQTICLLNSTVGATARAGISAPTSSTGFWSTVPAVYLAGINDGNGDNALGLAYSLGSLATGASTTIRYEYAAGASRSVVTTVPEPSSLALIGLSLLGVGASLKRKRA